MNFNQYIQALQSGRYKIVWKLPFLQPDGSTAFILGNERKSGYQNNRDTRAFLQDGSLNVSLKNGMRRKASITLANVDDAFSYNINNIWFGSTVKLLGGIEINSGEQILFPQGVFVIQNPKATINPANKTVTYDLADKWVNINGDNGGTLDTTFRIPTQTDGVNTKIFDAMQSLLRLSRYTLQYDGNELDMLDSTPAVFTDYYNDKKYLDELNNFVYYSDLPYEIVIDSLNGTIADAILELNNVLACWIGYDANGALRVDPSQDDISDANKPVLWNFTHRNSIFCGMSETAKTTEVKNDVIISGESLEEREIWGRASNYDDTSDTNIKLIGRRTYREAKSTYWTTEQCVSLAEYNLKKQSILQKSVTIESAPMFHLQENMAIEVERTDKKGSPVERHLIQSYTLPIAAQGSMQINATSVNDIPNFKVTSSASQQ